MAMAKMSFRPLAHFPFHFAFLVTFGVIGTWTKLNSLSLYWKIESCNEVNYEETRDNRKCQGEHTFNPSAVLTII